MVDEALNDYLVKKYSFGYISKQRNIPVETIKTWIYKCQRPELFPKHETKRGRPKKHNSNVD